MPAGAEAGLTAPSKVCKDVSGYGNKAKARKSMRCFTNYARAKKGLKRYGRDNRLRASSERKAGDILRCGDFSHEACGRPFAYWIDRIGYNGCAVGENIAWGSGGIGSSRSIFKAWMRSPGHRQAILSRTYRVIGIGLKSGKLQGYSGARVWVQNFGAAC
ncbi:MAG: CAP domain-containing protein [Solirubrobacterales bacterium]